MEILLVRHAVAEERDSARWSDDRGRPLTREGARKFRSVARILAKAWEKPDLVLSSPLARASQTAQILTAVCGWPEPEGLPCLGPDGMPAETVTVLRRRAGVTHVVLVGHEPTMHQILSLFLDGTADGVSLEMKKGGAALVRFDAALRAGSGSLLWLLPPRVALAAGGVRTARPAPNRRRGSSGSRSARDPELPPE